MLNSGIDPKDIAILYRNNYQSNQLELALKNNHINYVVYGKNPFYQMLECRRVIATYRFIKNPTDYLLFYILLPIKLDVLKDFQNKYNTNISILEYAKKYPNNQINDIANNIIELINTKSQLTKFDTFDKITEILYGNDIKTKQSENLKLLKDLIVSSDLLDECEILNEIMLDEESNDKPKGVRLMTIHKAKGLEFKCVFLISLNEGILPKINVTDEVLEEERRLAYVAITRAKEYLYISSAYEHYISGVKKVLKPSIFMYETK